MDLIQEHYDQLELHTLSEGLKEKCPIKYQNKIYICGKCKKCMKKKENK